MNWKITIQGNITGSKKEITGSSKDLNIQNSTWNGNTTILPFFKKENCNVTLSFVEMIQLFQHKYMFLVQKIIMMRNQY